MDAREEIKAIMAQEGVSYQKLADALGKNLQRVYYLLNHSNGDLGIEFYTAVMHYFERSGYTDHKTKAEVIDTALNMNQVINDELSGFTGEFRGALADGRIDPTERRRLKSYLTKMKADFSATIDKMLAEL